MYVRPPPSHVNDSIGSHWKRLVAIVVVAIIVVPIKILPVLGDRWAGGWFSHPSPSYPPYIYIHIYIYTNIYIGQYGSSMIIISKQGWHLTNIWNHQPVDSHNSDDDFWDMLRIEWRKLKGRNMQRWPKKNVSVSSEYCHA